MINMLLSVQEFSMNVKFFPDDHKKKIKKKRERALG